MRDDADRWFDVLTASIQGQRAAGLAGAEEILAAAREDAKGALGAFRQQWPGGTGRFERLDDAPTVAVELAAPAASRCSCSVGPWSAAAKPESFWDGKHLVPGEHHDTTCPLYELWDPLAHLVNGGTTVNRGGD